MKTSDLFKRAKQLADLEGSDFISWNEAINCINEAYIGLFEKLINMGDNSYVNSFRTSSDSVEMPSDFWQLKGVYLYNNGNLQTINRRADNNGIHHLSYELKNGSIYLYGNPSDVLVEYYTKPEKLFFKPDPAEADLTSGRTYLDCSGHLFIYDNSGSLCIEDVDDYRGAENVISTGTNNYITKNYVIAETSGDLTVYDMASGYSATISSAVPIFTEDGGVLYLKNDTVYRPHIQNGSYTYTEVASWSGSPSSASCIVCNQNNITDDYYHIESGNLYHNGVITLVSGVSKIAYSNKRCYFLGGLFGYMDIDDKVEILDDAPGLVIGFVGLNERTGYGYATVKYGSFYIEPYCDDTELDFPNSFYYQILSYMLAIAFRCKQGADISLLSNQLAEIENTFNETLGSDAYQFPRMGNVY